MSPRPHVPGPHHRPHVPPPRVLTSPRTRVPTSPRHHVPESPSPKSHVPVPLLVTALIYFHCSFQFTVSPISAPARTSRHLNKDPFLSFNVEEEIDVLSIQKPKRKRPPQVTDEPPTKRLKSVAVRPKAVVSAQIPSKESKKDLKRQNSTTSDEDGETSKRATHNVQERKRRYDLKTSFFILRDEVPELKAKERAAKITILRKAKDCVDKLKKDDTRFLAELNKEQRRNEELLDRLYALGQPKRK